MGREGDHFVNAMSEGGRLGPFLQVYCQGSSILGFP